LIVRLRLETMLELPLHPVLIIILQATFNLQITNIRTPLQQTRVIV